MRRSGLANAMRTINPMPGITAALRRALRRVRDPALVADLVFLEAWERFPAPGSAAALRVHQIRRANPALAAEIRAELARGRPLTRQERSALGAGLRPALRAASLA